MPKPPLPAHGGAYGFPTTPTSLVKLAIDPDIEVRKRAFGDLSERYRRSLSRFLRGRGTKEGQVSDLLQAYLLDLWESGRLSRYDVKMGPFRGFLMTDLKQFRFETWEYDHAQVRMPPRRPASLDIPEVLEAVEAEWDGPDPDEAYEREYFRTILIMALAQELRWVREKADARLTAMIEAWLAGKKPEWPDYSALTAASGLTENQVRNTIHDFRKRAKGTVQILLRSETQDIEAARDDFAKMLMLFRILGAEEEKKPATE